MRPRRRFAFALVVLLAYVGAYLAIRSKSSPEGKSGFGTMRSNYISFGASNDDVTTILRAMLSGDPAELEEANKIERRMQVLGIVFFPLRKLDGLITDKRVISRLDQK